MNYPTGEDVMEAVCKALNGHAKGIYSRHVMHTIPLSPKNVRAELSAGRGYRSHSDVRAIAGIILRKHTMVDVGFSVYKAPTIRQIRVAVGLALVQGGSGFSTRMVTLCELMRKVPTYRLVYVDAVRDLSKRFDLCAMHAVETTTPCEE